MDAVPVPKVSEIPLNVTGGLKKRAHPVTIKSEPIPVAVSKRSVLPSQKQNSSMATVVAKPPAASTRKIPQTASPSHREIEQLKCRLEASGKLQAALEKRVNTLQQEKTDLLRARDSVLIEKEEALKRVKTAEDKCVVDELRLLRQLKTEEQKNKRLTSELDEVQENAQNFRQVLALYKEKVGLRRGRRRRYNFQID